MLKSRNWLQYIPPVLCNIVDNVPQKAEQTNSSLLYKKKDKSLLAHEEPHTARDVCDN